MKKPLAASAAKKKNKSAEKPGIKSLTLKSIPAKGENKDRTKMLIHQVQAELFEKMDQKFNALNHRLDRLEDGIEQILDELRATEALLESGVEPFEGQA
jgi:hypothetical protein